MGYYTTYNLTVEGGPDNIIEQLREECDGAQWALDNDGCSMQAAKWYERDEDISKFSKKHPDALFILDAKGEEGEEWRTYVKGGKSYTEHQPGWTPPPFDATQLA